MKAEPLYSNHLPESLPNKTITLEELTRIRCFFHTNKCYFFFLTKKYAIEGDHTTLVRMREILKRRQEVSWDTKIYNL